MLTGICFRYMEKVAFLQRVDDRRLTQLKAGQRASRKN